MPGDLDDLGLNTVHTGIQYHTGAKLSCICIGYGRLAHVVNCKLSLAQSGGDIVRRLCGDIFGCYIHTEFIVQHIEQCVLQCEIPCAFCQKLCGCCASERVTDHAYIVLVDIVESPEICKDIICTEKCVVAGKWVGHIAKALVIKGFTLRVTIHIKRRNDKTAACQLSDDIVKRGTVVRKARVYDNCRVFFDKTSVLIGFEYLVGGVHRDR